MEKKKVFRFNPKEISIPRYSNVFGLPPRSAVFTNTERRTSWCERKWFFRHAKNYDTSISIESPMIFGRIYHELMEDVHKHWMNEKTAYEASMFRRVDGPCRSVFKSLVKEFGGSIDTINTINGVIEAARKAAQGYLERFGYSPPEHWEIVGVEEELCFPVYTPQMKHLKTKMFMFDDGISDYRFARPDDNILEVKKVVLPWYHLAKLDYIARDKDTGSYYVGELKTSSQPLGYTKNLWLDPQIAAYSLALMHAINTGWCESKGLQKGNVSGYIFEVAYNGKHILPKVLKDGSLSKDNRARIFSWNYMNELASNGLDWGEYSEHIQSLKERVDEKLYIRHMDFISSERVMGFSLEAYNAALKFTELRRNSYQSNSDFKVELNYPRTALCRARHNCQYDGICVLPVSQSTFEQASQEITWTRRK